jgi:SAM-dependent methyltransferase
MSNVKEYYASNEKQTFYQKYWGGESIHVGIYLEEYINEDTKPLAEYIREASHFKSDVMSNLIRSYLMTDRQVFNGNGDKVIFSIADWGSGYGGTARTISDQWNGDINCSISCYDLSDINCEYNGKINLENRFSNIAIYNQSFLDIERRWFDIIYSEDAFVHLNDKELIFKRAYENLCVGGHFIFSDIILKNPDTLSPESLDEICRRINVETIGSKDLYIKCAEEAGLTLCNVLEYNNDINKHYKYIKQFYLENESSLSRDNDIVNGLNDWIKHAECENITIAIFVFKK